MLRMRGVVSALTPLEYLNHKIDPVYMSTKIMIIF